MGPAIVFHLIAVTGGILYGLTLCRTDFASGIVLIVVAVFSVCKDSIRFVLAFYACFAAELFS